MSDNEINELGKKIKSDSQNPENYLNRGIAYGKKGEYELAIKDYTKVIELKRDYAEAYYNRGVAYVNKGEYELAIKDYTKAIELKPNNKEAYYNRGVCYGEKGEHELAIKDCTKAIELKPDYVEAYYNRGVSYGKKGEHKLAIKDYTKAIELKPNYAEAYNNRGIAYGKKGEYDLVIKDCTKAIKLKPNNEEAYYNRGIAYGKKGEHKLAIKDYTKAIELKPNDEEAYYNRGVCYGKKGEHKLAIKDYTKAIELKHDYAEAYYNRGVCYGEKGEHKLAIKDYTKAIELDPKNPNYTISKNTEENKKDIEDYKNDLNEKYKLTYSKNISLQWRNKKRFYRVISFIFLILTIIVSLYSISVTISPHYNCKENSDKECIVGSKITKNLAIKNPTYLETKDQDWLRSSIEAIERIIIFNKRFSPSLKNDSSFWYIIPQLIFLAIIFYQAHLSARRNKDRFEHKEAVSHHIFALINLIKDESIADEDKKFVMDMNKQLCFDPFTKESNFDLGKLKDILQIINLKKSEK
jgi:tetratricopeptide (TPR) repeat protein